MPKNDPAAARPPRLSEIRSFGEYMARGWASVPRQPDLVPGAAAAAGQHRARLSAALPGRPIVVAAGSAALRANDTYFSFRPHSDFVWLTGASVEHAVLVLRPARSGHDAVLYLPPPAVPGEPGFFGNAQYGELWVGPSPSLAEWAAALEVEVRPLAELRDDGPPAGCWRGGGVEPLLGRQRVTARLARTLAELRAIKDDWEVGQLRQAVALTIGGFGAVAAELPAARAGCGERWLQGTFDRFAAAHGNGAGYATIVGSGPNAPTLHWTRCDGPVRDGDAVLLDMGVEARSCYTADVTRTIPAAGSFTAPQRAVHDLVEAAHRAALKEVRPGAPWPAFHHAAMAVIATGLHDWGLLEVSVDEALSPQGQQHRRWLVCGIGHHLGLDVHDCSALAARRRASPRMAAGMVTTVEPGLYFHAHDELVPPELRGIGVRIEQDVLVTDSGHEVLDEALPIDAAGLERWVARACGTKAGLPPKERLTSEGE